MVLAGDVLAIALFVLVGRRSHEEGLTASSVARTGAPFVIGLAIGWIGTRAWNRPVELRAAVVVAVVTVALGLVLRNVGFDDGTAVAFVIVTTLVLGGLILASHLLVPLAIDRIRPRAGS